MSEYWENLFSKWRKPLARREEEKCKNAIGMVSNAMNASETTSNLKLNIFTQGSYANNTNVREDSDVDICVCYGGPSFFPDYPDGFEKEHFGNSSSNYNFLDYKKSIKDSLTEYFGCESVQSGDKAFKINSNTYRVNADVIACFEHRRYPNPSNKNYFLSGIEFVTSEDKHIRNWPEQHFQNGVGKNNLTGRRYKSIVRVLKKLKYFLIENKEITDIAPSFLIECLVWNTPNTILNKGSFYDGVISTLNWLNQEFDKDTAWKEWGEVSELKYLFRHKKPWTKEQAHRFILKSLLYIRTNEDG